MYVAHLGPVKKSYSQIFITPQRQMAPFLYIPPLGLKVMWPTGTLAQLVTGAEGSVTPTD